MSHRSPTSVRTEFAYPSALLHHLGEARGFRNVQRHDEFVRATKDGFLGSI